MKHKIFILIFCTTLSAFAKSEARKECTYTSAIRPYIETTTTTLTNTICEAAQKRKLINILGEPEKDGWYVFINKSTSQTRYGLSDPITYPGGCYKVDMKSRKVILARPDGFGFVLVNRGIEEVPMLDLDCFENKKKTSSSEKPNNAGEKNISLEGKPKHIEPEENQTVLKSL